MSSSHPDFFYTFVAMKKILLLLLCVPLIGFGQQTYVPDDDFEQHLINEGYDNVLDDFVQTSAIDTVSELHLGFFISNISDLTGIEDFTLLKTLSISPSLNLTTLDVSQNILLEYLSCSGNQLTNLDVTANTALQYLYCDDNQIDSLDVSNNLNLLRLFCANNLLTYLNVSNNQILNHLYCFGNLLTSLDVSNTPCGNWQEPVFNSNGGWNNPSIDNPSLFCVQVDNVACWDSLFYESIDTNYQYYSANCLGTSIDELATEKKLIKTIDILGRYAKEKKNTLLIYIYNDGTVEKRIVIE